MSQARQTLVALVHHVRATPPHKRLELAYQAIPLLSDHQIPVATRVLATARLLQLLPDRPLIVRRLARALNAGLMPSSALDRLRQVQHQLLTHAALDALIEERERQVRLVCPLCRVRLPSIEWVKHLWHQHGLLFSRGRIRRFEREIEEQQHQYLATGHAEVLDRLALMIGRVGLRRWITKGSPTPDELARLLAQATEDGKGLCPGCLTELPVAVPQVPEPLVLARGRLSGEGYLIEEERGGWFRRVSVRAAGEYLHRGPRTLSPRGSAALVSLVVFFLAILMPTWWLSFCCVALALVVFGLAEWFVTSDHPDDRVIDLAWSELVSGLRERSEATRWLLRLCRASLGHGDPRCRGNLLREIRHRAGRRATKDENELQLLAAASVLQIVDERQYGRDVVPGIALLAARGFRGELPASFSEYVVAVYLSADQSLGERARLRVLLNAAAFEAGFVPQDLLNLWAGAPALGQCMAFEPPHQLALLFGLWQAREQRAWQTIAPAQTVFELAATAPHKAAQLLARLPDLLLVHVPPAKIEQLVGPLYICGRGIVIGDRCVADPQTRLALIEDDTVLLLGRHSLKLPGQLPVEYLQVIRGFLQYRSQKLVGGLDGYFATGSARQAQRLLRPFAQTCPTCGVILTVRSGVFGRKLEFSSSSAWDSGSSPSEEKGQGNDQSQENHKSD
jgi:hypothetical protein